MFVSAFKGFDYNTIVMLFRALRILSESLLSGSKKSLNKFGINVPAAALRRAPLAQAVL